MAMGPNPTTKIGSNMSGEFTGFEPQPYVSLLLLGWIFRL